MYPKSSIAEKQQQEWMLSLLIMLETISQDLKYLKTDCSVSRTVKIPT
jgi:hypothetical protein